LRDSKQRGAKKERERLEYYWLKERTTRSNTNNNNIEAQREREREKERESSGALK